MAIDADEHVRELVAEHVDLRVDRLLAVDRHALGRRVARAAVARLQRLVDDVVAELAGELLQRHGRPRQAVALHLGERRIQRRRLGRRRQRLDLRGAEHRLEAKVRPRAILRDRAGGAPRLQLLLRRRAGRPHADVRALAALDAVAQAQPGPEAGDVRRPWVLQRDQQLVSHAVAPQPDAGADGQPALPAGA